MEPNCKCGGELPQSDTLPLSSPHHPISPPKKQKTLLHAHRYI